MNEALIRDHLVNKLDIFCLNLEYLEKESYVPNVLGTRGFIDILAKDSFGRLVIIELKKSSSSSREAIHEIYKYVEGIKLNKGLKDDEILVVIVSTVWDELKVPFSSFQRDFKIQVFGYELKVDSNGVPIGASIFDPLEKNGEREFSTCCEIDYYVDYNSLQNGITSYISCFEEKGITNYVLIVMQAPEGLYEIQLQNTLHALNQIPGNEITIDKLRERMDRHEFLIYSSVQVMSESEYLRIISNDKEQYEEIIEIKDDMEKEELLATLHEYAVYNVKPSPQKDHLEIGYPAKLSSFIEDLGWQIIEIKKNGPFIDNEVVSDKEIIDELRGSTGTTLQKYKKSVQSNNKSSIEVAIKEISECLRYNHFWKIGIIKALGEMTASVDECEIQISIYNPSNTIFTIYRSFIDEQGFIPWIPTYNIFNNSDEHNVLYFGGYGLNGNKCTFNELIEKYYDGDIFGLLLPQTWGGFESRDAYIAQYLGLEYKNYKCKILSDETRRMFVFDGFDYVEHELFSPGEYFYNYLTTNPIATEIFKNISERQTPWGFKVTKK